MAENVGAISYTVEADTSQLVNATGEINKSLGEVEGSLKKVDKAFDETNEKINKTGGSQKRLSGVMGMLVRDTREVTTGLNGVGGGLSRAAEASGSASFKMTQTATAVQQVAKEAQAANNPLGNLSKLLVGMVSLQGAMGLVTMAEQYGEMAERIRMATSSTEEYEHVQQRLLATANGTYRSMKEAQEMYILTADTLRSMGYTTDQAMDIVDSLSYSFVKNATSNERANSAISAFTNSMMKGKVESDAWSSIIAATPSIINDLAAASGKTASEIRELGATGKITSQQLSEGLRKSLDDNKSAAEGMATTVKDAFTQLRNNLSMYIGEANMASGATGLLSNSIMLFGENIDKVVNLLIALGSGALAKYLVTMGQSVVATGLATIEARKNAIAELDKARAHAASTTAAAANSAAMVGLGGSTAKATADALAHKAAMDAVAAAQGRAAAAGASLTAILGGPAGIIALIATAAAGFVLFGTNAAASAVDVDKLTDSIEKLTVSQLENKRLQAQDAIEQLKKSAQQSGQAIQGLERDYESLLDARKRGANISQKELDNVKRTMVEAKAENDQRIKDLQAAYDAEMKLAKAQEDRAKASTNVNGPAAKSDPEVLKNLAAMREQLELAKLEGEARAKLQALQKLGANATTAERAEAEKLATEIYRLENARKGASAAAKDQAKSTKDAAAEAKKAAEEQQRGYESAGQVLQDLALKIQLASMEGKELAITQAALAAGEYATPEQIEAIQELSAKLYDVEQRKLKLDEIMRAGGVDKWVTGDVDPLTGGVMDDQQARFDAEAAREQERYTAQLERLTQAMELERYTYEEYYAKFEEMAQTHADRMNQIKQASMQVQLASIEGGFGQAASAMKSAFGEQNALYKAAFVAQKAAAIAQSAIAIQQGIAMAAANPWPMNLAAMASVAAATASIIGNISSISMGGGRQYGGQVQSNGLYRINENGAPEIFNAANGQQYMLPNRRGEVVSNKDATQGGYSSQPIINVQLIEDKSRGGQVEQSTMGDETFIRAFVADIRSDGDMSQAIQTTFGLQRQGS